MTTDLEHDRPSDLIDGELLMGRAPTLDGHLQHLSQVAHDFVTHWMEDDGNDAADKARAAQTVQHNDEADSALRAALSAARAMLAALRNTYTVVIGRFGPESDTAREIGSAIAQAEAAGITSDAPR